MSFSGNAKASVSALPPERDCCAAAELRAMLSYAASFSESGVKFITETPEVSDIFTSLLLILADIVATPEIIENKSTQVYKTEITDKGLVIYHEPRNISYHIISTHFIRRGDLGIPYIIGGETSVTNGVASSQIVKTRIAHDIIHQKNHITTYQITEQI